MKIVSYILLAILIAFSDAATVHLRKCAAGNRALPEQSAVVSSTNMKALYAWASPTVSVKLKSTFNTTSDFCTWINTSNYSASPIFDHNDGTIVRNITWKPADDTPDREYLFVQSQSASGGAPKTLFYMLPSEPIGAADVLLALLPVLILVYLMVAPPHRGGKPSHQALPMVAILQYLIRLIWYRTDPNLLHAAVLKGFLGASTPWTILWGAIFLFKTMQVSGALAVVKKTLRSITSHRIGQIMLVGWTLVALIEGSAGFGTPGAIAAPLLAELGFAKKSAVIGPLIFDGLVVIYGAAGLPLWFAFGNFGLTSDDFLEIGFRASLINSILGLPVVIMGLWLMDLEIRFILKNIIFVVLSVLSVSVPLLLLSLISYEFPTLVAGAVGFVVTAALAKYGIGLVHDVDDPREHPIDEPSQPDADAAPQAVPASPDAVAVAVEPALEPSEPHIVEPDDHGISSPGPPGSPVVGRIQPALPHLHLHGHHHEHHQQHHHHHTYRELKLQEKKDRAQLDLNSLGGGAGLRLWLWDAVSAKTSTTDHSLSVNIKDYIIGWFPLWGTILLLIITRLPGLGIRQALQMTSPSGSIQLGALGTFRISVSLVLQLANIFGTSYTWKHDTLYVPSVLPFFFICGITFVLYRMTPDSIKKMFWETKDRLENPTKSLFAALTFVELLSVGGSLRSNTGIIGNALDQVTGSYWRLVALILGVMGSFFTGSATVCNLLFGPIQYNIGAAAEGGSLVNSFLALQASGASIGTMIAINGIVAACAVVGLPNEEGNILKRTVIPASVVVVFSLGLCWIV